jgi:hypothetical protein
VDQGTRIVAGEEKAAGVPVLELRQHRSGNSLGKRQIFGLRIGRLQRQHGLQ